MIPRFINLSLRGGGMVGRFLLIFFLARILPPEELGTYGIFTVTVGYALYFLGLDFYTYSGRAILHAEQKMWPAMLRDQAVLFACSYTVVFPLLGLFFWGGMLPLKYALVFYVLLTMEHLSLEFIRLLVVTGKPLAAGVSIFIRSGAWCYGLVAAYLGGFVSVDLKTVFWLWILADALAVAGGVWLLRKLPWGDLKSNINWVWIGQGLRVAALFLVGTLALRGIFTLDRYFIEAFSGREMLGVYTLYLGICTSLIGFVDAAVFSFRYPRLVSIYKSGQYTTFESVRREFGRQTLFAVTVLALAAATLIVPVLEWIDKPLYLQHLPIFFLLLAASTLFVIGHIPHYTLYAMGHDRSIVGAHIGGFIVFIVLGAPLAPTYGMGGVATALFMAVTVTGALKQWKFISLGKPGGPLAHCLLNRR